MSRDEYRSIPGWEEYRISRGGVVLGPMGFPIAVSRGRVKFCMRGRRGAFKLEELLALCWPESQRVKAHVGDCASGIPLRSELGWTVAPPHVGIDGRYYIWVLLADGMRMLPCHDVEPLKR